MKKGDCIECGRVIEEMDGYSCTSETGKQTVYRCIPCSDSRARESFNKDGEIRGSLWTDAIIATMRGEDGRILNLAESKKLMGDMEEVERYAKMYESEVWLGIDGLCAQNDECKFKGMSGKSGSLKVMSYCMCGRVMITIQDAYPMGHKLSRYNGAQLTLITTDDGEPRMGIQSIAATRQEACNLLADAIAGHPKMTADKEVCIF